MNITKLKEIIYWSLEGVQVPRATPLLEVLTHIKCHTTAPLLRSPRKPRLREHYSVNPTVSIYIKGVNNAIDSTIVYKSNGYVDIESLMPDIQLWIEENHSISNWERESREYDRVTNYHLNGIDYPNI